MTRIIALALLDEIEDLFFTDAPIPQEISDRFVDLTDLLLIS